MFACNKKVRLMLDCLSHKKNKKRAQSLETLYRTVRFGPVSDHSATCCNAIVIFHFVFGEGMLLSSEKEW